MSEITSATLLDCLKHGRPNSPEWKTFHQIYEPLIRSWLVRMPGVGADVDDLCQDVFVVIVRKLPAFDREREGSFRRWLRTVTANTVRNFVRTRRPLTGLGPELDELLTALEQPTSEVSLAWDAEHDRYVLNRMLKMVQGDFDPGTWEAFVRYTLDDRPAAVVAAELGRSEASVVLAKSRILKRLRQVAGELLE